jgi:RND family efflux transporter MFP subunit
LLKSKAVSEEEADSRAKAQREAEAALVAGKAAMETAQINLDFTRITAPIDGRIGRRMITEGNLVNGNQGQSTLLTTIVSLDPVYVYFDVYEQSALKYQRLTGEKKLKLAENGKLPAELELASETNFPHKGFVDFVENQLDFRTGTLRMRAIFQNPGPNRLLEPGYFGRVRLPGSPEYKALLITDLAVGTDQAQKFVYTLSSSNTAAYRPVKLGPLIDGLRVVYQGLQPPDKIIVNGLMSVRPGGPVNPQEAPMTGENKPAIASR